MHKVTIHGVSERQYEQVRDRLFSAFDAKEAEGDADHIECLGVRGELRYRAEQQQVTAKILQMPQITPPGYIFGWLYDALAADADQD
jgi:hypothetical protein